MQIQEHEIRLQKLACEKRLQEIKFLRTRPSTSLPKSAPSNPTSLDRPTIVVDLESDSDDEVPLAKLHDRFATERVPSRAEQHEAEAQRTDEEERPFPTSRAKHGNQNKPQFAPGKPLRLVCLFKNCSSAPLGKFETCFPLR